MPVPNLTDLPRLPEPGDLVVGKYRIQAMVGRGAMGVVYAARHEMLEERIALKMLDPEVANIPEAAARFVNEARISARVRSEHVCSILDVGYHETKIPYIAMEYVEGENLDEVLGMRGRLEVPEAIDIALQTLRGVAHAHALGVVHRDLKPANLMIRPDRPGHVTVKIVDFGVSKASMGSELTLAGAMLGSPTHMAPEQIRDSRAVDPRADIWAMGVILYELFTGALPFDAEGPGEVLRLVLESDPVPPRALCRDLSYELDAIVMRCLERSPEMRFDSARDLIAALEQARAAWARTTDGDEATIIAPLTPVPSVLSTIPPASLTPTSRSEPPAPASLPLAAGFRHAATACAAVVAAGVIVIFAFFATHPAALEQAMMSSPPAAAGHGEVTGEPVVPVAPPSVPAMSSLPVTNDAGAPHAIPVHSAPHASHAAPKPSACPPGLACVPSY